MYTNLPVDIILVRHGESEGNLAQQLSKKGNDKLWTSDFSRRHTSLYRLTDRGRKQAKKAGKWIKKNISPTFDHYYCSEYIRAQETAAILDFPNAKWQVDFYLREQDKGLFTGKSYLQREEEYADQMHRLKKDSFYMAPPGGESIANCCLRVDRVISMWHSSCAGQRMIAVVHGNIMSAFRVRLEGLSQSRYQEMDMSRDPKDKIHNCQILHYTRRNPATGEIESTPRWFRSICPWDTSLSRNEWQEIHRHKVLTQDLWSEVNKVPQLVNNSDVPEESQDVYGTKKRRKVDKTTSTQTPVATTPMLGGEAEHLEVPVSTSTEKV